MGNALTNKYFHGSGGHVWLGDEHLIGVKSISAKITIALEEVKTCSHTGSEYVNTGWTGEGTLTLEKTESVGLGLLGEATKNGETPIAKIITKLINNDTKKAEKVALYVVFSEFDLAKFEAKAIAEEELPFKIMDYEVLQTA